MFADHTVPLPKRKTPRVWFASDRHTKGSRSRTRFLQRLSRILRITTSEIFWGFCRSYYCFGKWNKKIFFDNQDKYFLNWKQKFLIFRIYKNLPYCTLVRMTLNWLSAGLWRDTWAERWRVQRFCASCWDSFNKAESVIVTGSRQEIQR